MVRTTALAVLVAIATLMFAGISQAQGAQRNPGQEKANLELVKNFYEQFFNRHEVMLAAEAVSEEYRQHNPDVPDGKKPFVDYFRQFFKDTPQSRARIVRSAASADLVWLQVHSTNSPSDRGQAVLDIFRVKNGKIVEHWDIIQDIPALAANENTMF